MSTILALALFSMGFNGLTRSLFIELKYNMNTNLKLNLNKKDKDFFRNPYRILSYLSIYLYCEMKNCMFRYVKMDRI